MMGFKSAVITDQAEAFSHNSCKKLAQLCKVLFTMTSEIQDRNDQLRQVNADMEESIAELINQHESYSEMIANNLINFRKLCISESCTEYGAIYKEKKEEFTTLIMNQNEKFKSLRTELKALQKSLRNLMVVSLKSAAQVLDSADEAEQSMKAAISDSETSKIDRSVSIELDEKLAAVQRESSRQIDEMKHAQRKEFEKSKQELLRHIRALLTERRPRFMELRSAIASYENNIAEFRASHQRVLEEMSEIRSDAEQKRRAILANTSRAVDAIRLEISAIRDRAEINRMGFEALRANMLKQREARDAP